MDIVIGPVLMHADGYRFDTSTAGKGMTRGYPYRRIEDAHYARNADIKASCAGSHPVRDRLPDPRGVHREIHRVRCSRPPDRACAAEPSHPTEPIPAAITNGRYRASRAGAWSDLTGNAAPIANQSAIAAWTSCLKRLR